MALSVSGKWPRIADFSAKLSGINLSRFVILPIWAYLLIIKTCDYQCCLLTSVLVKSVSNCFHLMNGFAVKVWKSWRWIRHLAYWLNISKHCWHGVIWNSGKQIHEPIFLIYQLILKQTTIRHVIMYWFYDILCFLRQWVSSTNWNLVFLQQLDQGILMSCFEYLKITWPCLFVYKRNKNPWWEH